MPTISTNADNMCTTAAILISGIGTAPAKYGRHIMMPDTTSKTIVTIIVQNNCFCPTLYLSIAGRLSSRLLMTSDKRLPHSRSYGWILLSSH